MIKIEKNCYSEIYRLYQTSEFFFPLIAAVLLDKQDGVVYVDDKASPSQAYVEHVFGFAQIFGKTAERFEKKLEQYLMISKRFVPAKIRLYAPYLPAFLNQPEYEVLRSSRQRFVINPNTFLPSSSLSYGLEKKINLHPIDKNNISIVDGKFGVVTRFWRSSTDFINNSHAVAVFYKGKIASLCYSASGAESRSEIDVLTLLEYRNMGLAKLAVINFVSQCFNLSLTPLWDCFTNNTASMKLCKSVGFVAQNEPYPLFTINK